ncbi:MAG: ribosomal RNA small subunit methyltransferase A [Candidatus Glassbacteria bacterium RIFCSPLOWO2_12_FULL_58_11]|uniref:Ribosomal RNA small subunit methyltransferase A n=1 Tax=Candidatus Glassbacteria bacterium RIFCSPLOWO2_12_FULL_58_11 TaxID=1817867 RepID=A0A1F5YQ33_9BACT|nr:MAG: ribosomal RNA small subunit methyltransferase A [Candidatus Glassbacteria bacterium RIFCSPLOWO2_12_FULL_58_11]
MSRPNTPGASRSGYRQKVLGQHFLVSRSVTERIISALGPLEHKHVLEIGAGRGVLTEHLAAAAGRLTALEIDRKLADYLQRTFGAKPEVAVLREDVLNFDIGGWARSCASLRPLVVGNIPYSITHALLHALIDAHRELEAAVLMLQEEVARKATAAAGGKPFGMLSALLSYYSSAEYLFGVGRENFIPVPGVDSAVVRLDFSRPCSPAARDEKAFRFLVRRLFEERRKQVQKVLRNNGRFALSAEDIELLARATGLDLTRRPEEFPVAELIALADAVSGMSKAAQG